MKRRALIIYCNQTESGNLSGPIADNTNLRNHLLSKLGGEWNNDEILSLQNPTKVQVENAIKYHISNADYSFVVFSGHGCIRVDHNYTQYLEIADSDISIRSLFTNVKRQTIIIDACRGYMIPSTETFSKGFRGITDHFIGKPSTRDLFTQHVLACEEGLSIMYAANQNQSAADSQKGGAYLFSILKVCEIWEDQDKDNTVFPLNVAHSKGTVYMRNNFSTIQEPTIEPERRMRYFPLAVKFNNLFG